MKNADLKNKHNHALTQWLKVGIFSLLMLAPLIASVSQWIYAVCNKNAKDSYGGTTENSIKYVQTFNFEYEKTYTLVGETNTKTSGLGEGTNYIYCSSVNYNNTEYTNVKIGFYRVDNTTPTYLYARSINENTMYFDFAITNQVLTFVYNTSTGITENDFMPYFYLNKSNANIYLDNAFYYGVDQMTKSELFNWTQNTALYTGIKGMTDNLEIGTPAIAILITYWTILTIAYVIIDILITGFTWITHLIVRND